MANSVDPDQMLHSVASDLGLHFLFRPVSQYLEVIMVLSVTITHTSYKAHIRVDQILCHI